MTTGLSDRIRAAVSTPGYGLKLDNGPEAFIADVLAMLDELERLQPLARIGAKVVVAHPSDPDNHPILGAILRVRYRNASDFSPAGSGARGEAKDEAILDCYKAVEAALASVGE